MRGARRGVGTDRKLGRAAVAGADSGSFQAHPSLGDIMGQGTGEWPLAPPRGGALVAPLWREVGPVRSNVWSETCGKNFNGPLLKKGSQ